MTHTCETLKTAQQHIILHENSSSQLNITTKYKLAKKLNERLSIHVGQTGSTE